MVTKPPPSATALFSVSIGSSDPIYKQLVDQVRRLVAGGQLAAGDELPSVRDVARALVVNPMTVSKAYSQLETAGVLERRRGIGMAVAAQHSHAKKKADRIDLLRPTLERAATESAQLEIDTQSALDLFEKILKAKK
ncbi:MAG: GntR family transcriptional regulator [Betaproteobacteria bacterium]